MMSRAVKNPVAQSLRERQFHQRILVSKKLYARHKEKAHLYEKEEKEERNDRSSSN